MNDLNGIVRSLIFDVVVKNVIKRLITAVPFLAFPGIGCLVSLVVNKLTGIVFDELSLMIEFKMIENKVGEQKDAYDKAVNDLKTILDKPVEEQKSADISLAKEELKKRLKDLVNFNPSK